MATYKTPGVYVEEIPTLPPSVAEVSTAIPAFIGYTEKHEGAGPQVAHINTLLDYKNQFGMAKPTEFTAQTRVDKDTNLKVLEGLLPSGPSSELPECLMYYCVSHYFKNGGGPCYIVSLGSYESPPSKQHYLDGLAALEKEDEPTLILLTDALKLAAGDYHSAC